MAVYAFVLVMLVGKCIDHKVGSSVVECLSRGFEPHQRHCVVALSKTH